MNPRSYIIAFSFLIAVSLIVSDVLNNSALSHTSGAPAMRTGSPGDGNMTCTSCHSGPAASFQAGLIISTIPSSGYVPGISYTITATITRSGHSKFGFQISPQNISGTLRGTLIVTSAETHLVGSNKYITHSTSGTSGTGSKTWSFNWTAPTAGSGNVTFYGAFLVTNSSNSSSNDTTFTSSLPVSECIPPAQPASVSGNTIVCPGSTHTYSVSPDANAMDYTWNIPTGWTGSSTSNSILITADSSSGTISVVANSNCGNSAAQTLSVSTDQLSVSANHSNVSCYNGSNGSATAIPFAGSPPFSFTWSGSVDTSATRLNLGAGTFNVTVTDANSCSATASATLTQPDSIHLSSTHSNVSCQGENNGSVTASAGGGTPGYTYSWAPSGGNASIASGLLAGNYTVTVTDSNGCIKSLTTNISQPDSIVSTINHSNVSCYGGTNGTATVFPTGGIPGYTYSWFPSGGTTQTASNLSAGHYTILITDTNGCSVSDSVNLSHPDPIAALTSSVNSDCGISNGTASIDVSGGTPGYVYEWNSIPVQTSSTAFNLSAGAYSVAITDTNGCTSDFIATVNDNTSMVAVVDTIVNVSCFGGTNGSTAITANGGSPGYTYSWFPSGGDSTTASNLTAGTYIIMVTDSLGCISTAGIQINQPDLLIANAGTDQSICSGESVVIGGSTAASGGTSPFLFSWSPPVGLDSTDVEHPQANPVTFTIYTLSVTDDQGCAAISDILITVNPLPQIPLILQNSDTLLSTFANAYQWFLNGDSIPNATGGYYIPGADGNYSVAVDSNGCSAISADYFFSTVGTIERSGNNMVTIYPNPYHDKTTITYMLNSQEEVLIEAYTITGIKITTLVNQKQESGFYRLFFSAHENNYPSGVYILKMRIGNMTVRKLVLEVI